MLARPVFIQRVIVRTLLLGFVIGALVALLVSPHLGTSILAGTVLVCANLRFMAWGINHLLSRAAQAHGQGSVGWTALFLLKLLALFGLTYYLIAVLGLSAVGFLVGYSLFVLVMVLVALTDDTPEDDEQEGAILPPDDDCTDG